MGPKIGGGKLGKCPLSATFLDTGSSSSRRVSGGGGNTVVSSTLGRGAGGGRGAPLKLSKSLSMMEENGVLLSFLETFLEGGPLAVERDMIEVLRLPRRMLKRLKRLADEYSLGERSCVRKINGYCILINLSLYINLTNLLNLISIASS